MYALTRGSGMGRASVCRSVWLAGAAGAYWKRALWAPARGLGGRAELEAILAAAKQGRDVGPMQHEDRGRRSGGEGYDEPGSAEEKREEWKGRGRHQRGHRRVAG